MAEKKFKGSPFGTQTSRFDVSGVHPKNKMPGTFTQAPYCRRSTDQLNTLLGPGRYNIENGGFSTKSVDMAASGPGWARAYEVSRMAALPHLLYKEQWQQKKLLDKKLGPGKYNIKDFLEHNDEKPRSNYGIVQTLESRFHEAIQKEETPGPGTYGGGGVPHAAVESKMKKSASTIGMLDSGSSRPRSLPNVGSLIGPGNYEINSFTDDMDKKVISLRGPYDLFSGDRNKPMRTGHLAAPLHANLGPGQYNIKSFVDENHSTHKFRHGRFAKLHEVEGKPTERIYSFTLSQNPRNMTDPGPGNYEVLDTKANSSHAKNSPGFLSSAQRNDRASTNFFTGNFNPVGAGRYDLHRKDEAQHRNGHSSVFKSKTMRPDAEREKFLQEQIRSKDVPLRDRVYIVEPEVPHNLRSQFMSNKALTVM